ncbi:peroxidase-related enzyme [Agromyces sp. MMS24-JH15]|uniref:peroxidase-related enzyme n=1 Tax=Agromyces sp. MMS24-JH15 TaxID=3243765 RepID=UPI0037492CC5
MTIETALESRTTDWFADEVLGEGERRALWEQRPLITAHVGRTFDAVFGGDPQRLSEVERFSAARAAAEISGAGALAEAYGAELDALGEDVAEAAGPRLDAIVNFATIVAADPVHIGDAHYDALRAVGLGESALVTLTLLVGFVSYQVRALAALTALEGSADDPVAAPVPTAGIVKGLEDIDFTLAPLDWKPRVEVLEVSTATERELEVLDAMGPWARRHPFTLTLGRDAEVFFERDKLTDASMESIVHGDALPPAEREFAALVESRVTGCRYCAFVHGNASIKLGGDRDAVHAVIKDGIDADLGQRARAIADFSAELAVTPPAPTGAAVQRLRDAGLSTGEILDLSYAVAQFAWANRTMLPLGQTVKPE